MQGGGGSAGQGQGLPLLPLGPVDVGLAGGLPPHIAEHGLHDVAGRDRRALLQQLHRAGFEGVEVDALLGAQHQLGQVPLGTQVLGQVAREGGVQALGDAVATALQALGPLLIRMATVCQIEFEIN